MTKGITRKKANGLGALLCVLGIVCAALALTQVPVESLEENVAHAEGEATTQSSNIAHFRGVYSPSLGSVNYATASAPAEITVDLGSSDRLTTNVFPSAINGNALASISYEKYGASFPKVQLIGWTMEPLYFMDNVQLPSNTGYNPNKGFVITRDILRQGYVSGGVMTADELVALGRGSGYYYAVYLIDNAVTVALGSAADGGEGQPSEVFYMAKGSALAETHGAINALKATNSLSNGTVNPFDENYTLDGYKILSSGGSSGFTTYTMGTPINASINLRACFTSPQTSGGNGSGSGSGSGNGGNLTTSNSNVAGTTGISADLAAFGGAGTNVPDPAAAVISATALTSGQAYDTLAAEIATAGFTALGYYDVVLSVGGAEIHDNFGTLMLYFPVNAAYNDMTVTIWHLLQDGTIDNTQCLVSDGKAALPIYDLSTFAVGTDTPIEGTIPGAGTTTPEGGNTDSAGSGALAGDAGNNQNPAPEAPSAEPQGGQPAGNDVTSTEQAVKAVAKVVGEQLPQTADAMNLPVLMLGFFLLAMGGFVIMATRVIGLSPEQA